MSNQLSVALQSLYKEVAELKFQEDFSLNAVASLLDSIVYKATTAKNITRKILQDQ